jgi:multidrug efflux system membrane fusion protein
VDSGLEAGERVVTDGQSRLTEGATVQIKSGMAADGAATGGAASGEGGAGEAGAPADSAQGDRP